MKFSRTPHRYLALLYTHDFTNFVCIQHAWSDENKPQFMLFECVSAMMIAVGDRSKESLCALINVGTDVNELIDVNVAYIPQYLHNRNLQKTPKTHLEVAVEYNFEDIIKVLLDAGAEITINVIEMMAFNKCSPEVSKIILRHINKSK